MMGNEGYLAFINRLLGFCDIETAKYVKNHINDYEAILRKAQSYPENSEEHMSAVYAALEKMESDAEVEKKERTKMLETEKGRLLHEERFEKAIRTKYFQNRDEIKRVKTEFEKAVGSELTGILREDIETFMPYLDAMAVSTSLQKTPAVASDPKKARQCKDNFDKMCAALEKRIELRYIRRPSKPSAEQQK